MPKINDTKNMYILITALFHTANKQKKKTANYVGNSNLIKAELMCSLHLCFYELHAHACRYGNANSVNSKLHGPALSL